MNKNNSSVCGGGFRWLAIAVAMVFSGTFSGSAAAAVIRPERPTVRANQASVTYGGAAADLGSRYFKTLPPRTSDTGAVKTRRILSVDSRDLRAGTTASPALRQPETLPLAGKANAVRWQVPVHGKISSYFGPRRHPLGRRREMHTGIDIPGRRGDPIQAAVGGRVVFAGRRSGYGLMLEIDHGGGLTTVYAHCSSLQVARGAMIQAGRVIARIGTTGTVTGAHLHFEVRREGRAIDPLPFLKQQ